MPPEKAGLKVGLYYSAADWTHPDYPPFERDWPTTGKVKKPGKDLLNFIKVR